MHWNDINTNMLALLGEIDFALSIWPQTALLSQFTKNNNLAHRAREGYQSDSCLTSVILPKRRVMMRR